MVGNRQHTYSRRWNQAQNKKDPRRRSEYLTLLSYSERHTVVGPHATIGRLLIERVASIFDFTDWSTNHCSGCALPAKTSFMVVGAPKLVRTSLLLALKCSRAHAKWDSSLYQYILFRHCNLLAALAKCYEFKHPRAHAPGRRLSLQYRRGDRIKRRRKAHHHKTKKRLHCKKRTLKIGEVLGVGGMEKMSSEF